MEKVPTGVLVQQGHRVINLHSCEGGMYWFEW